MNLEVASWISWLTSKMETFSRKKKEFTYSFEFCKHYFFL